MTRDRIVRLVIVVLILSVPLPALAGDRGFVGGLGGVTFGTATSGSVAGSVGVSVSPYVQLFGEFGQMRNTLPSSENTTLQANAAAVASDLGSTSTPVILGNLPVFYGMGGVRLKAKSGNVTPFGEAAFGFAHITSTLVATLDGQDISSQVFTTPLTSNLPQTQAIEAFGGGVTIAAGKQAAVDIGYRYSHIGPANNATPINTSALYGALHFKF
jgi:opacity protein-like surface antigen